MHAGELLFILGERVEGGWRCLRPHRGEKIHGVRWVDGDEKEGGSRTGLMLRGFFVLLVRMG